MYKRSKTLLFLSFLSCLPIVYFVFALIGALIGKLNSGLIAPMIGLLLSIKIAHGIYNKENWVRILTIALLSIVVVVLVCFTFMYVMRMSLDHLLSLSATIPFVAVIYLLTTKKVREEFKNNT